MDTGKKAAIGGTLLLLAVVGVRVGLIYRERNAPEKPIEKVVAKVDDDQLVFLKQKRQSSMADVKELIGSTLWVSAGGQMDYYRAAGHTAEYGKKQGTLLGAVPVAVKDAFEQVAPKQDSYRIPPGEKQVLLAFTLPKSDKPDAVYAVPVGYRERGIYTFQIDEIFFYDDPHELYKYWNPEVWKAIDEHRVMPGMNERQVQLALGQVSKSLTNDYGDRTVVYANMGKPFAVTFVKNKATAIQPEASF